MTYPYRCKSGRHEITGEADLYRAPNGRPKSTCKECIREREDLQKAAVKASGLTQTAYRTTHDRSRETALAVLAEHERNRA